MVKKLTGHSSTLPLRRYIHENRAEALIWLAVIVAVSLGFVGMLSR